MGSSPGLKPPRSGCITTCWQSRSPTSLPVHRKRLRDRLRHVRGPAGRRTRVKTHKSQKSLRPSRFRLPESLEGIRKERVGSTSYAFMSLDPSTTLADLFVLPFCADPLSAVRALMRRQSNDEIDDGSAHGWQAGLRWWSGDSFFPASLW